VIIYAMITFTALLLGEEGGHGHPSLLLAIGRPDLLFSSGCWHRPRPPSQLFT